MKINDVEISKVFIIDFMPSDCKFDNENFNKLKKLSNVEYKRCLNIAELLNCLKTINEYSPIVIQIIAHGCEHYIANTLTESLSYNSLFDLLRPINANSQNSLFLNLITVCLSENSKAYYDYENPQFAHLIAKKGESSELLVFKDSLELYCSANINLKNFENKYAGRQYVYFSGK